MRGFTNSGKKNGGSLWKGGWMVRLKYGWFGEKRGGGEKGCGQVEMDFQLIR